jgi:hypothetical protein
MISGSTVGVLHDWKDHSEDPTLVNNTWRLYSEAGTLSNEVNVTPPPPSGDTFMFTPSRGASDTGPDSPAFEPVDLYPFVYALPDGNIFVHSRTTSRILSNPDKLDPNNLTSTWSAPFHTVSLVPRTYPRQGSSVLLPLRPADDYRAKILVIGGAGAKWLPETGSATSSVELLDLGASSPHWTNVAAMNYPRVLHDAVLLPDGKVFVVGGSAQGHADAGMAPVLTSEVYDPSANTWTKLCPMRIPRGYHSTALLLPDGRVMVAGKDGEFQTSPYAYPERRIEIYSPPYLFSGAARPSIGSVARSSSGWNQSWTVTLGSGVSSSQITSAALIRLGATTHGVNMDQRHIGLNITGRPSSTQLTVVSPPKPEVAPPGYYMLFVLAGGVPSKAQIIQLK